MPKIPPIGKRFQPGQVANPLGGKAHNPVVKAIKRMTNDDLADVGSLILAGNKEALKEAIYNPETPNLKLWLCTSALRAIERGDDSTLLALLDRILGKVKDTSEVKQEITINVKDYTSKKIE
jgi:hypothetical protein